MTNTEAFWSEMSVKEYREFQEKNNFKRKLSYDIQKIIPHTRQTSHLHDLCCGLSEHSIILNAIMGYDKVTISDINNLLVFNVLMNTPLNYEGYNYNLNEHTPRDATKADTILWLDAMHLINPERVEELFREFKNKVLIIKDKFLLNKDNKIDLLDKLKRLFNTIKYERLYPNELNSEDEKYYLIVCRNA
jgi:hypothetical protein